MKEQRITKHHKNFVEQPQGVVESGITIYLVYEALVLISKPQIFQDPRMVGNTILNSMHISEIMLGFIFAALAVMLGLSTIIQIQSRAVWAQMVRIVALFLSSVLTVLLAYSFLFDFPNMLNGALLGLAVVIILTSYNAITAMYFAHTKGGQ